ncbi:MAG: hypothetical protein Q7R96_03075 [Nanoarchaeota archaeon]|nr:hypothetical protein [Nanoarchaeota archaeon]
MPQPTPIYTMRLSSNWDPDTRKSHRADLGRDYLRRAMLHNKVSLERLGLDVNFRLEGTEDVIVTLAAKNEDLLVESVWATASRILLEGMDAKTFTITDVRPLSALGIAVPEERVPINHGKKELTVDEQAELAAYKAVSPSPGYLERHLAMLIKDRDEAETESLHLMDKVRALEVLPVPQVVQMPAVEAREYTLDELLVLHVRALDKQQFAMFIAKYQKSFVQGMDVDIRQALERDEYVFIMDKESQVLAADAGITLEGTLAGIDQQIALLEQPFEKTAYGHDHALDYIGACSVLNQMKSAQDKTAVLDAKIKDLVVEAKDKKDEYESQRALHEEQSPKASMLRQRINDQRGLYVLAHELAAECALATTVTLGVYVHEDKKKFSLLLPTTQENDSHDAVTLLLGYIIEALSTQVQGDAVKREKVLGTSVVQVSLLKPVDARLAVQGMLLKYQESCLAKLGVNIRPCYLGGIYD